MRKYFLPSGDSGKAMWLSNFASKISAYAAKYGIAAAEVADMDASDVYFSFWLTYKLLLEEFKLKVTAFKNEIRDGVQPGSTPSVEPAPPVLGTVPPSVPPGVFVRATSIANRIKDHKDYTVADGMDLGIEGSEFTIDLNNVKPALVIILAAAHPEISFKKLGLTALEIHVKRSEAEPFAFLDIKFTASFTDMHALPSAGQTAIWKYKAIYRMKDEQVGLWSDEVSIVVGG